MTTHKSIFYQAQEQVCETLNNDEVLSGKVTFISENSKDIDYEIKNAMGRQGIVGVVMTPEATYQGITDKGEQVWDLRDFTVQVVENPIVNRGQPNYANITALDAVSRATEVLADPRFGLFGQYCPTTIEQGEDTGLIVAQCKFNVQVKSEDTAPYTYIYFDNGTTNKVLWKGEVTHRMGEDAGLSDVSPTARIVFGTAVSSIADEGFVGLPVTEASFKPGLVSIGRRAFAYNGMITKVELPDTVQSIAEEAFLSDQNIEVSFQGRTKAEVQAMTGYPWGL